MRILVEEEYGFKHWLWEVDATWDEIKYNLDEKINRTHWYASNLPYQFPDGDWTEIDHEEYRRLLYGDECDVWCHLHTEDDSEYKLFEEMDNE